MVRAYDARAMTIEAHSCNETYERLGWCGGAWEHYCFLKQCFLIVRREKAEAQAEIDWKNAWMETL